MAPACCYQTIQCWIVPGCFHPIPSTAAPVHDSHVSMPGVSFIPSGRTLWVITDVIAAFLRLHFFSWTWKSENCFRHSSSLAGTWHSVDPQLQCGAGRSSQDACSSWHPLLHAELTPKAAVATWQVEGYTLWFLPYMLFTQIFLISTSTLLWNISIWISK